MVFVVSVTLGIAAMVLSIKWSSAAAIDVGQHAKPNFSDILFALDYSGSTDAKDFEDLRAALNNSANVLDIGEDKVHVGIIIFNCSAHEHLGLKQGTTKDAVLKGIESLPVPRNGWNLAGEAMDKAEEIFKKDARNGSVRIFVLITDGITDCLPFINAPCFGTLEEWTVAQCRTKSKQCAKPGDYTCKTIDPWEGCPDITKVTGENSIVYNQAENLKAGLGVNLVTVRMGTCSENKYKCEVNMKCWANDNMSFWVKDNKGLAKELGGVVSKVISINPPPKDCRYFWQEGGCKINESGKGTLYECTKRVTAVKLEDAGRRGKKCPKDKVQPCNLEECYSKATEDKASVVYYAIKLVQVKRKPPKESALNLIVIAGLIVTLIGTIVGIIILAVILLKSKTKRHGKSTGVQMTARDPLPSKRGRKKGGADRDQDLRLAELEKQSALKHEGSNVPDNNPA